MKLLQSLTFIFTLYNDIYQNELENLKWLFGNVFNFRQDCWIMKKIPFVIG